MDASHQPSLNNSLRTTTAKPVTPFDFDAWFSKSSFPAPTMPAPSFSRPREQSITIPKADSAVSIEKPFAQQVIKNVSQEAEPSYIIIGQLHKTYILLEHEEGLLVIDQHAAHERILYEEFKNRFTNLPTINLMFPLSLALSRDDMALIEPHLALINQHGIGVEVMGPTHLSITATPVHLKNAPIAELVREVVGAIKEFDRMSAADFEKNLHEKLHAQMACKAAVKAGDSLSTHEMKKLVDDLYKTENRFACPHGRPTGWLLAIKTFEKEFQRDYRT
jgi:DNA mismatch repair protein MutL